MPRQRIYKLLVFVLLVVEVTSNVYTKSEQQCFDYYKTGENYDLLELQGKWYTVFYWPPIQRQRDVCETVDFKIVAKDSVTSCSSVELSPSDTVIEATYNNSANKKTTVFYYGKEEVKSLFRSCDRIYKYILLEIDDKYVLGINCSAGGRGVLLSKNLPTAAEVADVVRNVEIMSGREGSSDCKLM